MIIEAPILDAANFGTGVGTFVATHVVAWEEWGELTPGTGHTRIHLASGEAVVLDLTPLVWKRKWTKAMTGHDT